MFKDFNRVGEETVTRAYPSKKIDRTKTQFRRNRPVGQPEQDGSAGKRRYQEGRTCLARNKNKKHRKTEEVEYTCPYKT